MCEVVLNVFEVTENLRMDVNYSCRNLQSCTARGVDVFRSADRRSQTNHFKD